MHHKTFINEMIGEIKIAIQIALFKEKDMHHVAIDKKKNNFALIFLAAALVSSFIGQQLFSPFSLPLIRGIFFLILQFVGAVGGIFVFSFIAQKLFKGHGKHEAFFRIFAYSSIIGWISIFPILGLISCIWGIALLFVIIKLIHKLKTPETIGVIVIGALAMMIVMGIISSIFGNPLMYGGKYKMKTPDGSATMESYGENFEMNFKGEDGVGGIKMEDGKMTIVGEDGNIIEYEY